MRYLSACSGIEAATVAWHPLGWEPVAFSEIEAFPSAVLAHHYPSVPNRGDMTRYPEWPDVPALDLLVGGTPCQSFSVAGLRQGLADPRGNLALVFLGIVDRYRPRWVVWENVPGVLSSNDGRDFGAFLGGLAELGYGWAYRVLDAQYVRVDSHPRAVPQRRRRVFVVGCAGGWAAAAAVLFERESLSGHLAPRREAGERIAPTIASRPTGGGGLGTDFDCDGGVIVAPDLARCDATREGSSQDWETTTMVAQTVGAQGADSHPGAYSGQDAYTGRLVSMAIQAGAIKDNPGHGPDGVGVRTDGLAYTIEARAEVQAVMTFDTQQITSKANRVRVAPGLPASTLNAAGQMHVASSLAVRRLTPRECERLQGFPDDYTAIPYRGKPASDGPRYKALGNSMAVNVMAWIGQRIQAVDAVLAEQSKEAAA